MNRNPSNWLEKHRPYSFDKIKGNESNLKIISNFISRSSLPHLLFFGPPGTGKTTAALTISKQLFPSTKNLNVLEMNASDDRGISTIRDKVKTFISTKTHSLFDTKNDSKNHSNKALQNLKIVILDEIDSMTNNAQFSLRRMMEIYSKTVRFILICNDPYKVIPAIKSRCIYLRFKTLKRNELISLLKNILEKEIEEIKEKDSFNFSKEENLFILKKLLEKEMILEEIADCSNGDARNSISILEKTFSAFKFKFIQKFKNEKNNNNNNKKNFNIEKEKEIFEFEAEEVRKTIGKVSKMKIKELKEFIKENKLFECIKEIKNFSLRENLDCRDLIESFFNEWFENENLGKDNKNKLERRNIFLKAVKDISDVLVNCCRMSGDESLKLSAAACCFKRILEFEI